MSARHGAGARLPGPACAWPGAPPAPAGSRLSAPARGAGRLWRLARVGAGTSRRPRPNLHAPRAAARHAPLRRPDL